MPWRKNLRVPVASAEGSLSAPNTPRIPLCLDLDRPLAMDVFNVVAVCTVRGIGRRAHITVESGFPFPQKASLKL